MTSLNPEMSAEQQDASMPTIIALEASPSDDGIQPDPEAAPVSSPTTLLVQPHSETEPAMSKLKAALTAPRTPSSSKTSTPVATSPSAATSVVLSVEATVGRPAGGPRKQLQFLCENGRVVTTPLTVGPPSPRRPPAEERPEAMVATARGGGDGDAAAAAYADPPVESQWVVEVDGREECVDTVDAVDAGHLESQLVLNAEGVVMEAAAPSAAGQTVSHVVFEADGGPVRALQAGRQVEQQVVLAVDGNVIGTADQGDGRQIVLQVDEESDSVTLLVDRLEDGAVYELAGSAPADCELLQLWERGAGGADHAVETVSEVSLVDIRAVCEQCGCAISHHMVGLLTRQDGSEYGYRCRICQSVQTDVDEMARHMDTHRPPADTQCRFCSRGIRSFKPAAARTYTCHACQMVFSSRHEMIKHREVHPLKRRFPCELCDKAFQMKVQLEVHMRAHLGHRPYSCDMCPATFTQPSHLINHRRTHTGERPYSCEHCGRAFVQQGHLRAHERTHTGERPYTCDICDRGFRQSGQLTAHKKLHEGDTPFKLRRRHGEPIEEDELTCRECRKRFKAPKDLRRHLVVHGSGEFKCVTCERFFKRLDHLKRHLRQHEKPPQLPRVRRRRAKPEVDPAEARGLSLLDKVIDAVLEAPESEEATAADMTAEDVAESEMEAEDAADDPRGPVDALWSQADRGDDARWRRAEELPGRRPPGRAAYGRRSRLLPAPTTDDGVDEEMAMLEAALRDRTAPGRPHRGRGVAAAAARRRRPAEPTVKLEPVDWANWDAAQTEMHGHVKNEEMDEREEGEDWDEGDGEDPGSGGRRRGSREDGPDSSAEEEMDADPVADWPIIDVVEDSVDRAQLRPVKRRFAAWQQVAPVAAAPRTSRRSTAGNWAASVGVSLTRTRGRGRRGKR